MRWKAAVCAVLCAVLLGGSYARGQEQSPEEEPFAVVTDEKDFSALDSAKEQEKAYEYRYFFLPSMDGFSQPYVGDTMPYYEDGVYYIYYLKEAGDSYNHSIYLATTTDFLTYTEYDAPILTASDDGQDRWIGTGSVVKVQDEYYLFYTGHTSASYSGYAEKILLAKGRDPLHFEKVQDWDITPDDSLGQKNDFRDPQGYYDEETGLITLTVTASQDGLARILKYTLSSDLTEVSYDGILFTDPTGEFWNLECSDLFCLGDSWYLTYSGQDDTLWYASADSPDGPFEEAQRADGKLFYAAKHVESPDGSYMVGWARHSESPNSTRKVSDWAGNLAVQELSRGEDGHLILGPVKQVLAAFDKRRELLIPEDTLTLSAGDETSRAEVFTAYERFLLKGSFTYTGEGSFGLAFDFNGEEEKYKLLEVNPAEQKLQLLFNGGKNLICETAARLTEGEEYSFTYLQEGSVGIFYLDGDAALTLRLYGVSGRPIRVYSRGGELTLTSLREYT